ncbi:hypothetical protein [Enemella sp. A6]|uniref:hypothetical protein n=1 Tax=Enemella sp. A6 TaxID=3440152 RepID=UPI003EB8B0E0
MSTRAATPPAAATPASSAPDRFMHRVLRTSKPTKAGDAAAHRAFRISLVISAVRCLATYLLVPILIPLVNVAGVVAAPIGIALCAVAVVNGIIALRRFWTADHKQKWLYTWFMVAVFAVLAIALVADINRLVNGA